MKQDRIPWQKKARPLVAWIWLVQASAVLFPVPLAWLAGGVVITLIGTIALTGQRPRDYSWFLPCLPLVVAWYIVLPVPTYLAPLTRLGIVMGVWITMVILLLSLAIYFSQPEEPDPTSA